MKALHPLLLAALLAGCASRPFLPPAPVPMDPAPESPTAATHPIRVLNRHGQPIRGAKVSLLTPQREEVGTTNRLGLVHSRLRDTATSARLDLESGLSLEWPDPRRFSEIRLPIDPQTSTPVFGAENDFGNLTHTPSEKIVIVRRYDGTPIAHATITTAYDSVRNEEQPRFTTGPDGKAVLKMSGIRAMFIESGGVKMTISSWQPGTYRWPLEIRLPLPPP